MPNPRTVKYLPAVAADPTLSVDVKTEAEANDAVTKGLRNVLDFVSYFIGSLMGGVTFPMAVTPHLVWASLSWALSIALIGGISPSIRAARMSVANAMRAT
jgi:hypothetical protein